MWGKIVISRIHGCGFLHPSLNITAVRDIIDKTTLKEYTMSLYVCGDTHGDADIRKLTTKRFDHRGMTRQDYVLICGDFGGVWDLGSGDDYIIRWFEGKPWTTLFVDGNHENHDVLDAMPVTEWMGGKIHRVSKHIIHLMRGQVYTLDGHTVFTMGGASSHDRQYRREGVNWWARELPAEAEFAEARENLASHGNRVDYVFTHAAPTPIHSQVYEPDRLTDFLGELEIDFGHWYFGHYHQDAELDGKYSALFDRVVRLW